MKVQAAHAHAYSFSRKAGVCCKIEWALGQGLPTGGWRAAPGDGAHSARPAVFSRMTSQNFMTDLSHTNNAELHQILVNFFVSPTHRVQQFRHESSSSLTRS